MAASITAKTPFAMTAVDTNAKLQINKTSLGTIVFNLKTYCYYSILLLKRTN